jgi:hypothetical protein
MKGKPMFRHLILAASMLSISALVQGAGYERNGLPCVDELCIGDGISEISKVTWDSSKNPKRKLYDGEKRLAATTFKGNIEGVIQFLIDQKFDATAISGLSQVTAACVPHKLIGTYTTTNGISTQVSISLIPDIEDASSQKWTVISIVQSFPTTISKEQKDKLVTQLANRYKTFDILQTTDARPGEGRYAKNFGIKSDFGFNLMLFRGSEEGRRMKMHSACGELVKNY